MASWAYIVKGNGSCAGTTQSQVSRNTATSSQKQGKQEEVKQSKQHEQNHIQQQQTYEKQRE